MIETYTPYVVSRRVVETPTISTVWLFPKEGERPDFISGQFVNVHVPELGSEAKSYSIASTPRDAGLALTVRVSGNFSRAILARGVGDELLLSEPLGYFYPEDNTPRIFLAGGIGIVPYMSIIRDSIEKGTPVETVLLYSNRTHEDVAFKTALDVHTRESPLTVRHFITRASGSVPGTTYSRIGGEHLKEVVCAHPEAHIYVCGSVPFVRDMRLYTKELGVPEERQFAESFF